MYVPTAGLDWESLLPSLRKLLDENHEMCIKSMLTKLGRKMPVLLLAFSTVGVMRIKSALTKLGWKTPVLLLVFLTIGVGLQSKWFSKRNQGIVDARTREYNLESAPLINLQGIVIDSKTATVNATAPDSSFMLGRSPNSPRQAVASLVLSFKPLKPFHYNEFLLYSISATSSEPDSPDRFRVSRGLSVETEEDVRILWNLPEPALSCRVVLPKGAVFRLERLEITETDEWGSRRHQLRTANLLLPGLVICLALIAVQFVFPRFVFDTVKIKEYLLVGLVFASAVPVFLLPPFQGPDEWIHWRTALVTFRRDFAEETLLTNLYEPLDYKRIRFRTENQFHPLVFRTPATQASDLSGYRPVGYATILTYPIVGVMAWVFPRVETIHEALVFYYLCRLIPLVFLFLLLFAINRQHRLPYLAIIFFSSPLVLQQFTVISADTVPCLGTLLAVLLFLRFQPRPSPKQVWLLGGVCLVAVLAKPPALASILLLPLLCVRPEWIPRRRIALPLFGLLVVLAGVGVLWKVVEVTGNDPANPAVRQLAFVNSVEGAQTFLRACYNRFSTQDWVTGWFHPLGWLDTYLNDRHLALIRTSVWVAALLDVVQLGPLLLRGALQRKLRACSLAAVLAANWLFLILSTCFLLYVMHTPLGFGNIIGFQTRYLFPAAILALFLPLAVVSEDQQSDAPVRVSREASVLSNGVALGFLPLLLAARQVELATDLLVRYW